MEIKRADVLYVRGIKADLRVRVHVVVLHGDDVFLPHGYKIHAEIIAQFGKISSAVS